MAIFECRGYLNFKIPSKIVKLDVAKRLFFSVIFCYTKLQS